MDDLTESEAMVEGIMDLDDRIQELEKALVRISDGVKNGKANMSPGEIYDICQTALAKMVGVEV